MDFPPFNAPTDPAYLRFLKGLKGAAADPAGSHAWGWRGHDESWHTYDPKKWGLEDFGAANTAPEMALAQHWNFPNSTWTVNEFAVPSLFERLKKAYALLAPAHPKANLVWNPWAGGRWRSAFERRPSDGKTPPPPPPCMDRIKEVQAYESRGVISHDQAAGLIEEIVAECT